MEEPEKPEAVLVTDARGRVRVDPARREAVLDELERSGMSGAAFARHYGYKYSTFASWVARRRKEGAPGPGGPAFAELVVEASAGAAGPGGGPGCPRRVVLACGASLEVSDGRGARLAAELIGALGGRCRASPAA